jgi:regulatory protein
VSGDHLPEVSDQVVDPLDRALQLAYAYLNRRERTVAEVRRHLEAKAVGVQAIDQALDVLCEQMVLDDVRFARVLAEDKRELDQWGSDRIRSTLLARGVDRETIDATLGGEPRDRELERALELLRRRFSSPPRERRTRDRAIGVLLRKGYDGELALDALAAYARGSDERSGASPQ